MQVSGGDSIDRANVLPNEKTKGVPILEGVSKEVMELLKQDFLSLVYFDTCRNLSDLKVSVWSKGPYKEILGKTNFKKMKKAIKDFDIFDEGSKIPELSSPSKDNPVSVQRVRLKGQEKYHFKNKLCTKHGYTDYLDKKGCILKDPHYEARALPTQKYGYHEISLDQASPKLLYTLWLGPCIGILAVGIGKDGEAKKVALMHEDYSCPQGSVTDIFDHSFKENLKDFSQIAFYLIGGNGGEEYTQKRYRTHKSEIEELKNQHEGLVQLVSSSDELDSTNIKYRSHLSNVFFSTIENSTYLWIEHRDGKGGLEEKKTLSVMHISGPELSYEKLDVYFNDHLLKQMNG